MHVIIFRCYISNYIRFFVLHVQDRYNNSWFEDSLHVIFDVYMTKVYVYQLFDIQIVRASESANNVTCDAILIHTV